ncbi:hypothetical protein LT85_0264 [Collimonas arenae]|uniref:Uncharacterized protein n=1 Tax=Collimonas arenae TaxID=279058 RepID=A0A0A1F6W4_9BURK|nr:hypothetical protein [Collimonas arenae]AIY39424.1 hypothetical protein LT85_0264 [Collimonas arenae]
MKICRKFTRKPIFSGSGQRRLELSLVILATVMPEKPLSEEMTEIAKGKIEVPKY